MKKNNKGFTVVEMGVSFCLIFTICILLFQVILSLKELYISSDIETTLLNKQGILLNKIYKDFEKKGLAKVPTSCGLNCLEFSYADNSTAQLIIDTYNKTITYNDYTWKLDNASKVTDLVFLSGQITGYGKYFKIKVNVTNKLLGTKDYGLDIVYSVS